jgi:hypothetical protein
MRVKNDSFSVEDRRSNSRSLAAAADNPDARWFDVDGEAIAVPFDFEGPIRPDRRRRLQQCQAWFDPIGHGVEGKVRLSRVAFASRLRFRGETIVMKKRLCGPSHLPVRVSAATAFFKASMMLMTLLGAGAGAGALALAFDGFFRRR